MKKAAAFFILSSLIFASPLVMAKKISANEKALWSAIEDANQEKVESLIRAKVNINAQDMVGETALIKAVANDNDTLAAVLLKHKANVNLKDEAGNTALYYSVSNNNEKLSNELLKANADLKLKFGEKKESILFAAARSNAAGTAKLLLEKDPKLAAELNLDGQNALFASVEVGNSEVTKIMVQNKLDPDLKDKSGKTPKDLAKSAGFKKTLEALSTVSH